MKHLLLKPFALLALCCIGSQWAHASAETAVSFLSPSIAQLSLTSIPNLDRAGNQEGSSMLYPAPTPGLGLVGVLTHAIISDSARNSEKTRIQQQADALIAPYQSTIKAIPPQQVFQSAIQQLNAQHGLNIQLDTAQAGTKIEAKADQFQIQMTPDQRALIVLSSLKIQTPGTETSYTLQTTSTPLAENLSPLEYWNINNGENLKNQLSAMIARMLRTATRMQQLTTNEAQAPQKTHRYLEGGTQRMQRGQLLAEECNYITIKNLRGWILDLPKQDASEQTCNTPAL